jgi:hypothetical protein
MIFFLPLAVFVVLLLNSPFGYSWMFIAKLTLVAAMGWAGTAVSELEWRGMEVSVGLQRMCFQECKKLS